MKKIKFEGVDCKKIMDFVEAREEDQEEQKLERDAWFNKHQHRADHSYNSIAIYAGIMDTYDINKEEL